VVTRYRITLEQQSYALSTINVKELVSADFFIVPTATFSLLFVFLILSHDRRRPVHFAVTGRPTADWTARQLLQAFSWDTSPRYLLRRSRRHLRRGIP
jgi:hypothetical protein